MYDLVIGPKPADVPASPVPTEPDLTDNAAPPEPGFGIAPQAGILLIAGVGFQDLTNTKTISTLTFTVWHFDETAPVETTLTAPAFASSSTLAAASLASFAAGDLALLDTEIVRIASISGDTAQIARGQKGSTAADHAAGSKLIRLDKTIFVYNVPRNFFGTPESGAWEAREPFRSMAVCAVELYATNIHGNSPAKVNNYTDGFLDGRLRILSGEQVDLIVEGVIGIESDAVPPVYLRQATSIRDIYAYCKNAPQGGDINAVVKVGGVPLGTVVINDGQTFPANVIDGKDLPAIRPTEPITLDITSVGATYPGERLVVSIRL
jgi:hypothetical protein